MIMDTISQLTQNNRRELLKGIEENYRRELLRNFQRNRKGARVILIHQN